MSPAAEQDANPVRIALMKLLKADAGIKDLAGGVYYRKAPQPREVPYVIVSKAAGTPEWTFDGEPMRNEVFVVKGVGSPDQAEAIDLRCKKLLGRDVELEIEGREFHSCFWISDLDYEDPTDGERFQHVGAEYRIKSEVEE